MKSLFSFFIILTFCMSCKKNYTCDCTTIDPHQGFINPVTYHVKEKNKTDAMSNCARQYDASGYATGGVNCVVK